MTKIYLGLLVFTVLFITGCTQEVGYTQEDALEAAWVSVNDSADFIGIDFELEESTDLGDNQYQFTFVPVDSTIQSSLTLTVQNATVLESVLTQGSVDAYVNVTNFATCVTAGNPVMESYPEQCYDPKTNQTYVNPDQAIPVEPDGGIGDGAEPLGEVCSEPRPDFCTKEYVPVCGSDGQTYGNACTACSNEDVDRYVAGTCESKKSEAHICTADQKSAQVCTMEYAPVCGSDGNTYGNGCGACAAQVDSYVQGEC